MLPYFWYMLKVIICSGILFGYYWFFLRNKIFHQYNRFYLLAAMSLSLLLPLLKINFWQQDAEKNQAIRVLQAVSAGDEYMEKFVVTAQKTNWSLEQLYPVVYILVSFIFFLVMLRTLYLIRTLLKKYPVQQVEQVAFVNTEDDSTPFSFLKYIFWNSSIDINTTTGRQIFKHEVAHIQEKHTHDKLFVNIILIFCWCNPFFWLYRKELNMIHEFIADKKAVEDSDTAAFAAMILQAAYPRHRFELTNNFFYSPIKRRLLMLTKNKNPKVNYIGRIMVLPLVVLVFAAFSLKTKNEISKVVPKFEIISNNFDNAATIPLLNSLFKAVNASNSTADTFPIKITETDAKNKKPVYILNGKEIDEKTLEAISPNQIESVNVIKDKNAIEKYGEKGKNGVVEVFLKKQSFVISENNDPALKVDSFLRFYDMIYKGKLAWKINNIDIPNKAIYILNGKEVDEEIAAKIADKDVADIKLLKGIEVTKEYGSKGTNGLVIINTKTDYEIRTWKSDTIKFYRDEKIPAANKKMLVIVDGKFYYDKTIQQVADEIQIIQFESILLISPEKAIQRYGDRARDGAVVVTIKKSEQLSVIRDSKDLNVANQEAKIYLGNNSGGAISLDYLKSVKEISISTGYKLVGASIYFEGSGFDKNVVMVTLNSNSLSSASTYINRCGNGAKIVFDDVKVENKNGVVSTIKGYNPVFIVDLKKDLP